MEKDLQAMDLDDFWRRVFTPIPFSSRIGIKSAPTASNFSVDSYTSLTRSALAEPKHT